MIKYMIPAGFWNPPPQCHIVCDIMINGFLMHTITINIILCNTFVKTGLKSQLKHSVKTTYIYLFSSFQPYNIVS